MWQGRLGVTRLVLIEQVTCNLNKSLMDMRKVEMYTSVGKNCRHSLRTSKEANVADYSEPWGEE